MKFRTPGLPLGVQIHQMAQAFPALQYRRDANIPTWVGGLTPFDAGTSYVVRIEYRFANRDSKPPRVWVISPELVPNPPHIFADRSLCLYFAKDQTWTSQKSIAQVIVPLTCAWLGFYDIWLSTNVWYGPEAPHDRRKKQS